MTWAVHKFGGSSLSDAAAFERAGGLLSEVDGARQAVVVSAMAGTTDVLIGLARSAAAFRSGGEDWRESLETLVSRHEDCAAALGLDDGQVETLRESFSELRHLLEGLELLGTVPAEVMDLVSGLGEQWSARLLTGWFESRGEPAEFVDAREVILVRRGELGPVPLEEASRRALLERLEGCGDARIVVPGFCCREEGGRIGTLGRNGSDFSATILAALLEADSVTIWTDVEGVLSADPQRVPQAQVVGRLSYREAFELAYFGARVLHPQTLAPLLERDIPLRIRCTTRPEAGGTLIERDGSDVPPVKGVSCIEDLALINIEGAGMLGVPGTARRVFETLNGAGISVSMISQGSSEHSICCVVPDAEAGRARDELQGHFERELASGQLQRITLLDGIHVLAIVGDGMAGAPGVAGRLFTALGRAGVNVRAIAQGSSERNISVAVDAESATRALRAVHSAFYLSDQTLSIGLVGPGQVGRALLRQVEAARADLLRRSGIDLRVRAVANSRRMELADRGLSRQAAGGDLSGGENLDLERFADHVQADHLPHALIIDCSASDEVAGCYAEWLSRGLHVITPNKHAGSGDAGRYRRLRDLADGGRARWRYEATVGAGLPVLQTLRDLVDTGDRVERIEGILSGTLAWLFNRFEPDGSFSALVREARESGFTEPDPRDDLSGIDVARKLVILAREIGLAMELDDVEVESLVPDSLAAADIDGFMKKLDILDADMDRRLAEARARGQVLRYTAALDVGNRRARVGLVPVPDDHAFAHLALTDNVVAFTTERYRDNPLIVQGPGAGPEVTAAGVFSDLLRIAQGLGGSSDVVRPAAREN